MSGLGLVTQCIDNNQWNYRISTLSKEEISQLTADAKSLAAAVHNSDQPSAELGCERPVFSGGEFLSALQVILFGHGDMLKR